MNTHTHTYTQPNSHIGAEEEEEEEGKIYVMEIFIRMKIMIRDDTMCHDLRGHVPTRSQPLPLGHLPNVTTIMMFGGVSNNGAKANASSCYFQLNELLNVAFMSQKCEKLLIVRGIL